jgi:hypothetical protein
MKKKIIHLNNGSIVKDLFLKHKIEEVNGSNFHICALGWWAKCLDGLSF